jgi:hypothetical protein
MTKILTLDEMLECLRLINHPTAAACQALMESLGTAMAETIAAELDVVATDATFEGVAFAGTCACFSPAFKGQPCPQPLAPYDPGQWDAGEADHIPDPGRAPSPPTK